MKIEMVTHLISIMARMEETIYSDLKNCTHIAVRNQPNLAWVLRKYKRYCDLQNYLEYHHVTFNMGIEI